MDWSFVSNNGGDVNGISNAGIETFQGARLKSLAREICQNSVDAVADNSKPVVVEFKSFSLPVDSVPGIESLSDAFRRARDFWAPQNTKKAVDFFNEAIRLVDAGTIPFLRVSDFNTKGLQGSDGEYNTPWCNLTKSTGTSDKGGTAGGSFGIGKFAPFACSTFRTVVYNTVDIDGKSASQGISRITSFRRDDGEITTGVGYYGAEGNKPFETQISLEPSFSRKETETGTDVYICGFKRDDDWKNDIVASVVDGFLFAIFTNKLEVRIDDIVVNSLTLPQIIEDYKQYFSEHADNYYRVLTSGIEPIASDYRGMGTVKLWLFINTEMHKRVALVRQTGMKIFDKGSISSNVPFAGLLYIEGDIINNFLRDLENPQHTKWEPERHQNKQYARNVVAGIIDFIKSELEKLNQSDENEEINPDVGDMLAEENVNDSQEQDAPEEAISNTVKEISKKVTKLSETGNGENKNGRKNRLVEGEPDEDFGSAPGSGAGSNGGQGGTQPGNGNNPGSGTGPNPKEQPRHWVGVSTNKVRAVCLNKTAGEYSLLIVPRVSASDGTIKIMLSAETDTYEAKIVKAMCLGQKDVTIDRNSIKGLSITANEPLRLRVTIDYHDYCSLEVEAYGYTE